MNLGNGYTVEAVKINDEAADYIKIAYEQGVDPRVVANSYIRIGQMMHRLLDEGQG